ncbi:uncharacterized protein LOC122078841 isoform X2 [Macadamia integrifolia]|uniref:uncharacterized protein LOC122078841 isoform X2 n=1 Tax=Macadamia integrifolia TaxID=60698 RepID=UPI001C4E4378|nr:uncharacterized protein LOC122078841 isoform X2 [Macadamia integrifolia]
MNGGGIPSPFLRVTSLIRSPEECGYGIRAFSSCTTEVHCREWRNFNLIILPCKVLFVVSKFFNICGEIDHTIIQDFDASGMSTSYCSFSSKVNVCWGWIFILFGSVSFLGFFYAAILSKLLPQCGNQIMSAIQNDRLHVPKLKWLVIVG